MTRQHGLLLAVLTAAAARADVDLRQADDHSIAVTTPVYAARFDASGNLAALLVGGAPSLRHAFGNPGAPLPETPSVNVRSRRVAVRCGPARVEWTFGEDGIHVLTEGYPFECRIAPSVKAVVAPGGKGGPLGYCGGSIGLVLSNNLTVRYAGMHVHQDRFLPSGYTSGSVKAGELVEFDLKLGEPAEAVQLLSGVGLEAVGTDRASLRRDGNQGNIPHYSDPSTVAFRARQQNLSSREFALTYRLTVLDHYLGGQTVFDHEQAASVGPGQTNGLTWALPRLAPGFYYATVDVAEGGHALTSAKQTFAVDLPHYTHALTRPPDFLEFWKARVAALRAVPFDERLTEVPDKSTEAAVHYDLELTIAAVDIHVPTSAGLSWTDKPYAGWGMPQGLSAKDATSAARMASDLAYFDPVNFAPDVAVPWITAYGLDDTLSEPQGIEVMFHLSPAPWKRISRDLGGHQYSPGFQQLQKDLAARLATGVQAGTDDTIMREH